MLHTHACISLSQSVRAIINYIYTHTYLENKINLNIPALRLGVVCGVCPVKLGTGEGGGGGDDGRISCSGV